ncbi:unnamed protein product [Clonostachys byssicola]|uniref:FAD-binding PCMH-type domain-containing protein n=1 Tax=Clonostachys byssicola TaxID=160290 RepID=A0A9N9UDF5_9HYPO|nr:unnamed protein product [Clonostachys byssicola]
MRTLSALPVVLFIALARADTCTSVEALGTIQVARPLTLAYTSEQNEYWSETCSLIKPSCIMFPKSAEEAAAIVRILKDTDEDFAVKSGGHNPNNYFSSVENGPLISTAKLDHVELDQQTGVAKVGPGNRLDGISAKLDGTGWTFVGGRIGNTGVGGLILGGGLSYMSAQYGWSASSVLAYEVVLADGSIATASATEHEDLFKALKGGGNNFGIVTSYLLQTYRQGDIYGGNLVYARTEKTDKKLLKAVRDFTEYNTDDKAAVIVTAERTNLNLVDSWILFLFYDGPSPPQGIFQNFTEANPILNTLRTQSYASLMAGSNWVIVEGSTVQIATETVPLPSEQNSDKFFDSIHAHWRSMSQSVLAVPGIVASIAYQPFPKRIAQQALQRSDDLIAAEPDADKLIIEMNYSFLPGPYDTMADIMEATYTGVRNRVLGWQQDGTLASGVYLPLFMNYGFYRQDYFGRLKPENAALAKRTSQKYDPNGLFRERTGGWKP